MNRAVKIPRDIASDVTLVPQSDLTMADVKKAKREPRGRYCVAGAPNQQSCRNTSFTPGIRMHQFPSDPEGAACNEREFRTDTKTTISEDAD